jgi:hypothetical protein
MNSGTANQFTEGGAVGFGDDGQRILAVPAAPPEDAAGAPVKSEVRTPSDLANLLLMIAVGNGLKPHTIGLRAAILLNHRTKEKTQEQIAEELDITQGRVGQILINLKREINVFASDFSAN